MCNGHPRALMIQMKTGLNFLENNLAVRSHRLKNFKVFGSVISLIVFQPKEITLKCGQRFLYKDIHSYVLINNEKIGNSLNAPK